MQGWGGSCRGRGGSCRGLVGWGVMHCLGGSCRGGVGWCVSCKGGVGHVGMGWGVNNFMSQVRCSVFSSDKLLSTAFWIMWEKACFCLYLLLEKAFQFH